MNSIQNTFVTREIIVQILRSVLSFQPKNPKCCMFLGMDLFDFDIKPFVRCFTHVSYIQYLHENPDEMNKYRMRYGYVPSLRDDYQSLEFLGDRILKSSIGRYLYDKFHEKQRTPKILSKAQSDIESKTQMSIFSQNLGLRKFLLVGSLEAKNPYNVKSMDEDILEAFVGAIREGYKGSLGEMVSIELIDCWFRCIIDAYKDVRNIVERDENYKDMVKRYFDRNPDYKYSFDLITTFGPPNQRHFLFGITIENLEGETNLKRFMIDWTSLWKNIREKNEEKIEFPQEEIKAFMEKLEEEKRVLISIGTGRKKIEAHQNASLMLKKKVSDIK